MLIIIDIVLFALWSHNRILTKETLKDKREKYWRYDELVEKVESLKFQKDSIMKAKRGQEIVLINKTARIKNLEKKIDSLYLIVKKANEDNALNGKKLDDLENAINELEFLKEQRTIAYFEWFDSIKNNPEFINAEKTLAEWQNKNIKLRNIISEYQAGTFKLIITGQKTIDNKGLENRMAKDIKSIEVYFKIIGCVFYKQKIFPYLLDPQNNNVVTKHVSKKYSKEIIISGKGMLKIPVNIKKSGDYRFVIKTNDNKEIASDFITVY